MSAEDLDKLFRDKLQNRPVTPGNDVWERMQARMQPPVQQEEKKPVMWYWSAAAAVVLLITVSIWMLRPGQQINQGTAPMAKAETAAPAKADDAPAPGNEKVDKEIIENFSTPQATGSQALASIQTEGQTASQRKANSTSAPAPSRKTERTKSTVEKMKTEAAPLKLSTPEPEMLAQASTPATNATSSSTASAEPMEIIVKLDNSVAQPTKLAQTNPEPAEDKDYNNGRSTGKVVKGIFKQVKNLTQGEKIDLKELGLKHTYALETQIGNKKISKTITL
ncbi:hypothetical protein GU926_02640 [Nibribacter ruber]|uniref:Uncharacterized protein n=1 Tax=Nibribacter ruber TaxID=2698458 RepID=A0A6P1NWT8_9BACT|nr:hypothetical protein [Nibribacter ruber]QHL86398.1 hypothetical protein GU926_02640 [Nibribacter ruber]